MFRFTRVPGTDNTNLNVSRENQSVAYASSIALSTTCEETTVWVAQLTGALALTAGTAGVKQGDKMRVMFSADGTNRTVTPGSGISGLSAATIVVAASKNASLSLVFNGTNWQEVGRTVMA